MPRIWAALVPACLAACGAQADEGWVLQDVVLVSPERGAPLAGQSVWIRDGRIAAILTSEAELPSGVEIVDGEGRYLTPGLMDSHHHVSLIPGMGPAGIAVELLLTLGRPSSIMRPRAAPVLPAAAADALCGRCTCRRLLRRETGDASCMPTARSRCFNFMA